MNPNESTNTTYRFDGEDHTLGNLLRNELLSLFAKDPEIIFAAYQVPHPLTKSVDVRVQTIKASTDDMLQCAVDSIQEQLTAFETAFNAAIH